MPELDEFSFLPAQAADLGAVVPAVSRVDLALADGRRLSGCCGGAPLPRR